MSVNKTTTFDESVSNDFLHTGYTLLTQPASWHAV